MVGFLSSSCTTDALSSPIAASRSALGLGAPASVLLRSEKGRALGLEGETGDAPPPPFSRMRQRSSMEQSESW